MMGEIPSDQLRLHSVVWQSRANGPGLRAVFWTQGCSLACEGCFNPETHTFNGGTLYDAKALAGKLLDHSEGLEGITLSGGEPLQQPIAVKAFLEIVRQSDALSVALFSGFSLEQIQALPEGPDILACTDLLVAGLYDKEMHLGSGLLGSANQRLHFLTDRYGPGDIQDLPEAEIRIDGEGRMTLSGVAPLQMDPGE